MICEKQFGTVCADGWYVSSCWDGRKAVLSAHRGKGRLTDMEGELSGREYPSADAASAAALARGYTQYYHPSTASRAWRLDHLRRFDQVLAVFPRSDVFPRGATIQEPRACLADFLLRGCVQPARIYDLLGALIATHANRTIANSIGRVRL